MSQHPSIEDYSNAARSFLDSAATRRRSTLASWGEGSDSVALGESRSLHEEHDNLARAKAWARRRWDAGFGWIDGPPEMGGAGLSVVHRRSFRRMEQEYELPDLSPFLVGMALVGPTLGAFARGAASNLLVELHRGDLIACQLFSEPDAGSDLAALSTAAVQDGRTWTISGQKIWTSYAHVADVGLILCRTDRAAPAHEGITAFVVDMHAPGVTVRPLRQMTGATGFNDVLLDGVVVSDEARVGDVGDGWRVAMATLGFERACVGEWTGLGPGPGPFERLSALVSHSHVASGALRDRLAAVDTDGRLLAWTTERLQHDVAVGSRPDVCLTALRLLKSDNLAAIADVASGALGPALLADTGEWGTYAWSELVCGLPGSRLGGGSDEIVRNVIAERLLALPREPRC